MHRIVAIAIAIASSACGGGKGGDVVGVVECTEEGGQTLQRCDVGAGELCCPGMDIPSTCDSVCFGETGFACDGPEDCEGNPCCSSNLTGSQCATVATTCDPAGEQMCQTGADCPPEKACCLPIRVNGVLYAFCNEGDLPSCR
jgi:hypothetical protein